MLDVMTDALPAFTDTFVVVVKLGKTVKMTVVLRDRFLLGMDGETGGAVTTGVVCNVEDFVIAVIKTVDGEDSVCIVSCPNELFCTCTGNETVVIGSDIFNNDNVVCIIVACIISDPNELFCAGSETFVVGKLGEIIPVTQSGLAEILIDVDGCNATGFVVIATEILNNDEVVCIISDPNELFCSGNETFVVAKLGEMIEKSAVTQSGLVEILIDVDGCNATGFVVIASEILNNDDVVCIISDTDKLLPSGSKTFVLIKLGEVVETTVLIDGALLALPNNIV